MGSDAAFTTSFNHCTILRCGGANAKPLDSDIYFTYAPFVGFFSGGVFIILASQLDYLFLISTGFDFNSVKLICNAAIKEPIKSEIISKFISINPS